MRISSRRGTELYDAPFCVRTTRDVDTSLAGNRNAANSEMVHQLGQIGPCMNLRFSIAACVAAWGDGKEIDEALSGDARRATRLGYIGDMTRNSERPRRDARDDV